MKDRACFGDHAAKLCCLFYPEGWKFKFVLPLTNCPCERYLWRSWLFYSSSVSCPSFFEPHEDSTWVKQTTQVLTLIFCLKDRKWTFFAFHFSRERKPIIFSSHKRLLLKDVDSTLQLCRNFWSERECFFPWDDVVVSNSPGPCTLEVTLISLLVIENIFIP